jgi:NAD(P)H-hydrate epimerase
MKVLTGEQMREVDRKAIAGGIPAEVLMENAARRVVEFLASRYDLSQERIAVFCGKGNNGGDGLVAARILETLYHPKSLEVIRVDQPGELKEEPTLILDALLGTGAAGEPRGRVAELIAQIHARPKAKVIAVDIPSGIGYNAPRCEATVTFAAPKAEHYLSPESSRVGELIVAPIGIPQALIDDPAHWLNLTEPKNFAALLAPRKPDTHKGTYGHVLVVGGAPGKTGAAAMAGLAALRAGAGLVTVACSDDSRLAPELMSAPLDDPPAEGKTVAAIGPGLGTAPERVRLLELPLPRVLDADALTLAAAHGVSVKGCVLTPHPGEMSRLAGVPVDEIQKDRLKAAREFAISRSCTLVLKGHRTLIAFEDGEVWINPTGNPGMATGGTGDVLTGLIAGLLAQFPSRRREAVIAAVWLHGKAGDHAAKALGEQCMIATDLLDHLPKAFVHARL